MTVSPTLMFWPVLGMFFPKSAGLIADSTPYGGFRMDSPSTVRKLVFGGGAASRAVVGAGSGAICGASAAEPKPGPSDATKGVPATPITYRISENPAGGATSEVAVMPAFAACAKAVWVSGSASSAESVGR